MLCMPNRVRRPAKRGRTEEAREGNDLHMDTTVEWLQTIYNNPGERGRAGQVTYARHSVKSPLKISTGAIGSQGCEVTMGWCIRKFFKRVESDGTTSGDA